ncbi:MAG: hypothetical protein IPK34_16620 [Ramlibacter sp.]|jgi:hypothetical protein|nr:hypothetical protein [Ramlibacter sp.]
MKFHACVAAALMLWAGGFSGATAQTRDINAQGDSGACWARATAETFAVAAARNDARDACRALGPGWVMDRVRSEGQLQCRACATPSQAICQVSQAVYRCKRLK